MPLSGDLITDTGATASYHVIGQFLARPTKDEVVIRLDSYLNKASFQEGKEAMRQKRWKVTDQSYDSYFDQSVLTEKGVEPISQGEQYIIDNNSTFSKA